MNQISSEDSTLMPTHHLPLHNPTTMGFKQMKYRSETLISKFRTIESEKDIDILSDTL